MSRVMDAPYDDTLGHRRRSSRSARHAVRSHLHMAALDEDILDEAVLPVVAHDLGRKTSPKPKRTPEPPRRGGFKVWKTPFWKRRRRLWANRNAAQRAIAKEE